MVQKSAHFVRRFSVFYMYLFYRVFAHFVRDCSLRSQNLLPSVADFPFSACIFCLCFRSLRSRYGRSAHNMSVVMTTMEKKQVFPKHLFTDGSFIDCSAPGKRGRRGSLCLLRSTVSAKRKKRRLPHMSKADMCGGVSYARSAGNSLFFTGVLRRRLISGIIRGRSLRRNARKDSVPVIKKMFPGNLRDLKEYFISGLCLISEVLLSEVLYAGRYCFLSLLFSGLS